VFQFRVNDYWNISVLDNNLYLKLFNPCPEPIGDPNGITVAQPKSSKCNANIGSAFIYGRTVNPFLIRNSAAFNVPIGSGNKYFGSEITSSLTKSYPLAQFDMLIRDLKSHSDSFFSRLRASSVNNQSFSQSNLFKSLYYHFFNQLVIVEWLLLQFHIHYFRYFQLHQ
jgi:hypothetical protein